MNKKRIFYVLIALELLGVGYFIYNRFVAEQMPHIFSENSNTVATSTPLQKSIEPYSTTTKYYELSYEVPRDNKIVAESIKARADKWLIDTNIKNVTNDLQAERDLGIFEGLKYAYDSKYKIIDSMEYTSYVETIYEFTGGAHGAMGNVSYIFTKKGAQQINTLTDIYNSDIYNVLSVYTRKQLPVELAKKTISVSDFKDMFDEGTKPIKENWQVFYFKGSSLVIIFGQYQVGPYAIGIHELEVPLQSLEKYKK